MEFLKAIFNGKAMTYDELVAALEAHNGNEANKANQIKVGNLGGGEYVGKGKYDALQELLNGKESELTTANATIADLQKATKGNEDAQKKITDYEAKVQQLQAQNAEIRVKSALKVALLSEKALDVDYLTFKINEKMKEKGTTLELDDNDNIKGWDGILSDLKTQLPGQFEAKAGSKVNPNPLPTGEPGKAEPQTLAEALRMQYESN